MSMAADARAEFDPKEIARAAFPTAFRGYDQDAVRRYLSRLATAIGRAQAMERLGAVDAEGATPGREAELEAEVTDLRTQLAELEDELRLAAAAAASRADEVGEADAGPAPVGPRDLDEAELIELLGRETARVLEQARSAGADIVGRAETEAETITNDAEQSARSTLDAAESTLAAARAEAAETRALAATEAERNRLRREAEVDRARDLARAKADEILRDAARQAEQELSGAVARADEAIAEAERMRDEIVSDLVRRRRVHQQQLDRMSAARNRLGQALAIARSELEGIAAEIDLAAPAPTSLDVTDDALDVIDDAVNGTADVFVNGDGEAPVDVTVGAATGAAGAQTSSGETAGVDASGGGLVDGPVDGEVAELVSQLDVATPLIRDRSTADPSGFVDQLLEDESQKLADVIATPIDDAEIDFGPADAPRSGAGAADDGPVDDDIEIVADGDPTLDPGTASTATAAAQALVDTGTHGEVGELDAGLDAELEIDLDAADPAATATATATVSGGVPASISGSDDTPTATATAAAELDLPAGSDPADPTAAVVDAHATGTESDAGAAGAILADGSAGPSGGGGEQLGSGLIISDFSEADTAKESGENLTLRFEQAPGEVGEGHSLEFGGAPLIRLGGTAPARQARGDLPRSTPFGGTLPVAFERRDIALTKATPGFRRQLKRAVNDDQSLVLDGLRAGRGPIEVDELPDYDEQLDGYLVALQPVLIEVMKAGGEVLDCHEIRQESIDTLSLQLGRHIVDCLRRPTVAAIEASTDHDREAILDPVRATYRDFRNSLLPALIDDALHEAFASGLFTGIDPDDRILWSTDPRLDPDPICEENSAAPPLAKGTRFPSGHVRPLSMPGCRCLATPAP